ncbi:hypothetical protein GA0070624_2222 [Micromonospora rhizosphaerae]|uniref:Uncharacterized protein n=1 Tax=Micromonospora rhizosphaerae TaxID=568872 RepID=A0A1C6RVD9_9ACTN|nr:hypothetical protein [Micromonospora rhizosphaerae]SCL21094.1 hypothetical protein GA0070624_2222 [Micromonospora rhizosphaerae]
MERPLFSVLLALGVVMGCLLGAAYARARRGWADYQTIKKSVPGSRRTAWLLIRLVTTRIGVVALLLLGAVAYAAVGPDHERADPGPAPSVTPSPTPTVRADR